MMKKNRLQYMLEEGQKVILFTSTTSNEGKSFNAANLAASFAFMGKKTVVVGLDIRNPRLTKLFNISNKDGGITEYLAAPSSTDLLKLYQQTEVSPNLFVLPCGTIPPNPTELVARPSLEKAIQMLKEHFDYIILDTPPVGVVADAVILSKETSGVMFVVRKGRSTQESVRASIETLKMANANVLGFVMTDASGERRYYNKYGRYGRYGKYGKYGKYGYYNRYSYYGYNKQSEQDKG